MDLLCCEPQTPIAPTAREGRNGLIYTLDTHTLVAHTCCSFEHLTTNDAYIARDTRGGGGLPNDTPYTSFGTFRNASTDSASSPPWLLQAGPVAVRVREVLQPPVVPSPQCGACHLYSRLSRENTTIYARFPAAYAHGGQNTGTRHKKLTPALRPAVMPPPRVLLPGYHFLLPRPLLAAALGDRSDAWRYEINGHSRECGDESGIKVSVGTGLLPKPCVVDTCALHTVSRFAYSSHVVISAMDCSAAARSSGGFCYDPSSRIGRVFVL